VVGEVEGVVQWKASTREVEEVVVVGAEETLVAYSGAVFQVASQSLHLHRQVLLSVLARRSSS
jgi:hypothetical protein